MKRLRLEDIAPFRQGCCTDEEDIWLLNLDMVESNTGNIIDFQIVSKEEIGSSTIAFDINNILYSKLRPYLNKVVLPKRSGYATSEMIPLMPKQNIVTREYLTYFLRSPRFVEYINSKTAGAKMPRANTRDLKEVLVPCPTIEKQRFIVEQIDKIRIIIELYKQEIEQLDLLMKARFVEMFGDMLLNSKNWPEVRLDEIADIVSGITKGRKIKEQKLFEVPYMAVSNVKDGYIDWTTVKTIMASQAEINKYQLKPFDVLMTEGGDPDKVGRGAIIHEPPENCIHQNHIFRVRLDRNILLPEYMEQYLQQQKAKRYFLGCAKQTTGIASINMRQLTGLPVVVPEMQLQKEYVSFVHQVDKSKVEVQKALDKTQMLFDSLMQQYFG